MHGHAFRKATAAKLIDLCACECESVYLRYSPVASRKMRLAINVKPGIKQQNQPHPIY